MGSHIFLTSKENYEVCLRRGIYGGIAHPQERTNADIVAGFHSIKPSDFVFFYVKNVGIFGLWKVTSKPFLIKTVSGRMKISFIRIEFVLSPQSGSFLDLLR
jgi:hypothetical protein